VAARPLERVVFEVVELLLAGVVLRVHVALGPDRLEARLLDQQLASLLDTRILRYGDQRAPVHRQARARVRHVDDRRREVGVDRQVADVHPLGGCPGRAFEAAPGSTPRRCAACCGDSVLAVEVAVVGGEHEQGVGELTVGPQRIDDFLDALVHRQQRFQLAAVHALDVRDLIRIQERATPDLGRLVGDVGLVEVQRPRQRLGVERMGVSRRRLRGVAAVARWVRVRVRRRPVGRRVGEPEEERL
jgi:hypothetical protein